ncbi:MAG: DUF4468 domain-containing protein [Bacteroidia bacterium]
MKIIKYYFTLIAVSFAGFASAQDNAVKMPVNSETKLISYSKVVQADSVDKNELYMRAFNWAITFYKNPTDVIREKDPAAGKIVCKHRFKITNPPNKDGFEKDAGLVIYTLTIQVKDGRYKYDLSEINWKTISYYPIERWMDSKAAGYEKEYDYYLKLTDETAKKVLTDLETAMTVSTKKVKKDDW